MAEHLDPAGTTQLTEEKRRSDFVRGLLRSYDSHGTRKPGAVTPRVIVRFWNDRHAIPADVASCLDTWLQLAKRGYELKLFDDETAAEFIENRLSERHLQAFAACRHPAMRADYFRLTYISELGGVYVDADDDYQGGDLDPLVSNGLLNLDPLCYGVADDAMHGAFEAASTNIDDAIFYVNNNPLIAPPAHPLVIDALNRATASLLDDSTSNRDVQAVTGPGNLTRSLHSHATALKQAKVPYDFLFLKNWALVAESHWPLAYRATEQNWRNWTRHGEGPGR